LDNEIVSLETEKEQRDAICKEALSWRNTPYHDFAGIKGVGVDCAFLPLRINQALGYIPKGYKLKWYSPQKWVNNPSQTRFHVEFEDTTMLDEVRKWYRREITEAEVGPGDLMLCLVCHSWSHASIVISWPDLVVHAVAGAVGCVISSHGKKEGFWAHTPKRFFSMFDKRE